MGKVFFDGAPIGDPKDKKGQKLLTVEVSKTAKPEDGVLFVTVHDVNEMVWIETEVPLSGLILVGFPAHGVEDADEMLSYLDKACAQLDVWKKQRKCILPRPEETHEVQA